jgi:hypothetical protein
MRGLDKDGGGVIVVSWGERENRVGARGTQMVAGVRTTITTSRLHFRCRLVVFMVVVRVVVVKRWIQTYLLKANTTLFYTSTFAPFWIVRVENEDEDI